MMRLAALLFVLVLLLAGSALSPVSASKPEKGTTWVWFNNYSGRIFSPYVTLGLNQSDVLNALAQISTTVGREDLVLVNALSVAHGSQIQQSDIPMLKSYVAQLHVYAKNVVARLPIGDFNLTTTPTLYQVANIYAQIGVNGIWMDQDCGFYLRRGQVLFNSIMQNLTNQHPNFFWVLNEAGNAIITPLSGTTWSANTYVANSPMVSTYNVLNLTKMAILNSIYPGRMLMHFDADAHNPGAPMGRFADLNSTTEDAVVLSYLRNQTALKFTMIYPVLGPNTFINSTYGGTLYNSLSIGKNSRSTFGAFLFDMKTLGTKIPTL